MVKVQEVVVDEALDRVEETPPDEHPADQRLGPTFFAPGPTCRPTDRTVRVPPVHSHATSTRVVDQRRGFVSIQPALIPSAFVEKWRGVISRWKAFPPLSAALMATIATIAHPGGASAATGPTPVDVTVDASPPWGLIIGGLAIAAIGLAISVKRTRRWIIAGGVVAATAMVVSVILAVGTVGSWAGKPIEPWTIPATVAAVAAGLALAGGVILRYRPG